MLVYLLVVDIPVGIILNDAYVCTVRTAGVSTCAIAILNYATKTCNIRTELKKQSYI